MNPIRDRYKNSKLFLLILTCLCSGLVVVLGLVLVREVRAWKALHRGGVYGAPPDIAQAGVYPVGVNVSLEQYGTDEELDRALEMIADAGMGWIRQYFSWSEIEPSLGEFKWEQWDRLVDAARAYDLNLIAVLQGAPDWARSAADAEYPLAPPMNALDFGEFAREFAIRYRDRIDYYQIWDQPNIFPNWGDRPIDPGAYVDLLRAGSEAIREVDDKAVILTAGLAPNTEDGGRNMSEVAFLREMYLAGASNCFDVVATKAYGFWTGPDDRRVEVSVLNLSRVILLREEMVRQGDRDKAVWAVEYGWNALPDDWAGDASPWGTDTEVKQGERTILGIERARREWPWLGVICVQCFQPTAAEDDPIWGFSLVDANLQPRYLYDLLMDYKEDWTTLYPGWYWSDESGFLLRETAMVDSPIDSLNKHLEMQFWGTQVGLVVTGGSGEVRYQLDDNAEATVIVRNRLFSLGSGEALRKIVLARGLSPTDHLLRVSIESAESDLRIDGVRIGYDLDRKNYLLRIAILGIAMALFTWGLVRSAQMLPWWSFWSRAFLALPEALQWAITALCIIVFCVSPLLPLDLLLMVLLGCCFGVRFDLALASIVFLTPFSVVQKAVGSMTFSLVELLTVLASITFAISMVAKFARRIRYDFAYSLKGAREAVVSLWTRLTGMDKAVGFFVLISFLSLAVSARLRVSLRELRLVILEPVALYILLRAGGLGRDKLFRLVDVLVVSSVLLALHGLIQFAFTEEVIAAEGVRRIRGIYGSPNNMALVLGRVLPILVAVALTGGSRWRRSMYALSVIPVTICLFLTFSRGAWLLGVPVALLFIGIMLRGRQFFVVISILVVAGLCMIPLAGTERLASTFSTEEGTGFLRLRLWQSALQVGRDHPVWGIGLDNFLYVYQDYILPGAEVEPNLSHPHNILLDFWTRLGIPGVLALGYLLIGYFRSALIVMRTSDNGFEKGVVLGMMAGMVNFLAHGLVDNSYFVAELAFIFFFNYGLVAQLKVDTSYQMSVRPDSGGRRN